MTRRRWLPAMVAVAMSWGTSAWAQDPDDGIETPAPVDTNYPVSIFGPTTETVCAAALRPGSVKVDDAEDASGKCAKGAWRIAKLDDVPNRQALAICRIRVVPMRWYQWKMIRDRSVCREAAPEGEDNVMIIRRALDH